MLDSRFKFSVGVIILPPDKPSSAGSAGTDNSSTAPAPGKGVFYREGEFWTVGLDGNAVRLKDSRGLAYIAYLLRHPGAEFHVLDLVGGITSGSDENQGDRLQLDQKNLETAGIQIGGLGDAGEVLDDQAKRAYRRRLSELREELEEAKALGNATKADQLEGEIDELTRELSRAVGLGGRNRRAAHVSERARQTLTKTIKAAMKRIAQSDAPMGDFFSRCIKTGTFCSYQPDPDRSIAWEFAATSTEPEGQHVSSATASTSPEHTQASPSGLGVIPFSTAQRTPFIGREQESEAIRAVVDRAHKGSGSLVMLTDGPGVGKTRLAMEMAKYAARNGFACFIGRCYQRDEPFPYLPFVESIEAMLAQAPSLDDFRRQIGDNAPELAQLVPSLRRVFPDIPEPMELPPPQRRHYLFQSVTEALARAALTRPNMLILDDLHWADEATLALLIHLASRIGQLPIVIIGTYRDQYSDDNPALARTLEELIRDGFRPLKLQGLSKDSVAQMLDELSQRQIPETLVNVIYEESNGNPFFVEEVYRHLVEEEKIFDSTGQFRSDLKIDEIDVPENVRLIIARRLKHFTELEISALSAAAVIGRSFSFQLLAAVSQMEVDQLFIVIEKAQRLGMIVPSSEGPEKPFTFTHELVRQTLLADISVARRQQLHARAGAEIERLYPAPVKEHAGEIAEHLLKAGEFADREALVVWLVHAGNAAVEAAAFQEARAYFESALSRVDKNDSRRRAELFYSIGIAYRGLGLWKDAHRHWQAALELFSTLDDLDGIARTCVVIAQGAHWFGEWREAIKVAERGLTRLSGVSRHRALLFATLGVGRVRDGDSEAARKAFYEALAITDGLSDDQLKGVILAFRAHFNFAFLHLREAVEDSRRSAELTPAIGLWARAERLLWYECALYHLGHLQEAAEVGEELKLIGTKVGHVVATSFTDRLMLWAKLGKQPDLAELEDTLRRNIDAHRKAGLYRLVFMLLEQLSIAEFLHGKWEDALQHAEEAAQPQALDRKAITTAILVRLKGYAGDREGALAVFNDQRELLPRAGRANTYNSWILPLLAVEGLVVLGEREPAAALYPILTELIATGTVGMVFVSRFSQTAAGIAATAARNWAAAEDHFRTAMEQAESFPNQIEQIEIRRFHAMMLLDRAARGDRDKARGMLSEALESYARVGMRRHVELTQALIHQAAA